MIKHQYLRVACFIASGFELGIVHHQIEVFAEGEGENEGDNLIACHRSCSVKTCLVEYRQIELIRCAFNCCSLGSSQLNNVRNVRQKRRTI